MLSSSGLIILTSSLIKAVISKLEFTPGTLQDSDFYALIKSIGENLVY